MKIKINIIAKGIEERMKEFKVNLVELWNMANDEVLPTDFRLKCYANLQTRIQQGQGTVRELYQIFRDGMCKAIAEDRETYKKVQAEIEAKEQKANPTKKKVVEAEEESIFDALMDGEEGEEEITEDVEPLIEGKDFWNEKKRK